MPSRTPRMPSMGLYSLQALRSAPTRGPAAGPAPRPSARMPSRSPGRNSCSGGSNRRMQTGWPCMIWKKLGENHRAASAAEAPAPRPGRRGSRRRIISAHHRQARGVEEHVFGPAEPDPVHAETLRHRSVLGRVGIGAHADVARPESAQSISVAKAPPSAGSTISAAPTSTSPEVPSTVMISPSWNTLRPGTSQGLLALVELQPRGPGDAGQAQAPARSPGGGRGRSVPPRSVRMPSAACMPRISSGLVSRRTRIQGSPARQRPGRRRRRTRCDRWRHRGPPRSRASGHRVRTQRTYLAVQ